MVLHQFDALNPPVASISPLDCWLLRYKQKRSQFLRVKNSGSIYSSPCAFSPTVPQLLFNYNWKPWTAAGIRCRTAGIQSIDDWLKKEIKATEATRTGNPQQTLHFKFSRSIKRGDTPLSGEATSLRFPGFRSHGNLQRAAHVPRSRGNLPHAHIRSAKFTSPIIDIFNFRAELEYFRTSRMGLWFFVRKGSMHRTTHQKYVAPILVTQETNFPPSNYTHEILRSVVWNGFKTKCTPELLSVWIERRHWKESRNTSIPARDCVAGFDAQPRGRSGHVLSNCNCSLIPL